MLPASQVTKKWDKVLNAEGVAPITDKHKRSVTATLLENQVSALREQNMLTEAPNVVGAIDGDGLSGSGLDTKTGSLAGFDPVMISLVRRAMPNLMAYDICGVQPMSGPTGLIFAMKSHYQNRLSAPGDLRSGREALYNEPDVNFSGDTTGPPDYATNGGQNDGYNDPVSPLGVGDGNVVDANPGLLNDESGNTTTEAAYERYAGSIARETAESLGDPDGSALFNEMSFSIEKTSVTAKTRALRSEYTLELAQDLKAVHGLDAEQELANILSSEILAEINREVVRTVYTIAKQGAQANVANGGVFDLDVDSNGRWSVEKWKGLMFQIERDANAIAQQTRRGKGNFIITSADVASALAMSGTLDYSSGLSGAGGPSIGEVDDTGNLLVGTMNGRIKVYVDPYSANVSNNHYYVVGYKGSSPYDAGLFYCPYVPLQMLRSIDPETFQPKIGFKTRYGMVANPFVTNALGAPDAEALTHNRNQYYRRVRVKNLA